MSILGLLQVSLGWTLLHFCWQAAAIALVYGLADLGLSRMRSQARYLLSLAAILAMFAASLATLSYEIGRSQGGEPAGKQSGLAVSSSFSYLTVLGNLPAGAPAVAGRTAPINLARQAAWELSSAMPWLDVAWLLGVLCLSARTIGGWWWIQRLRRRALAEAPAPVLASFARVRERLGVRWRVDLRICGEIAGPLAIGVLRSLILLPASALLALSPEQMEVVLAHELAHVRRADYFWNLIQTMIETLFFFHPAVWWVGGRLREQRELCCDDIAVSFCTDPLLYATALLSIEEQRNRKLDLAMALDGQRSWSGLRVRIARMLGEALPPESKRGLTALPLAAFCVGIAILLLPTARLFASLSSARASRPQTHALTQAAVPAEAAQAPGSPNPPPNPMASPAPQPVPAAAPLPAAPRPVPHPVPHANPDPAQPAPFSNDAETLPPPAPLLEPEIGPQLAKLRANLSRLPATIGVQAGIAGELSRLNGTRAMNLAAAQAAPSAPGSDYIDQMRAAGYDLPLEKYLNLKIMGVTPEYARAMQKTGLGKPSVGNLIALKTMGVTPQYVEKLRAAGLEPHSFHELISDQIFHLSPDYLATMKAAGFSSPSAQELLQLRVQGITPEYAAAMRKQFPNLTAGELVQLRIFKIDDAFIAEAKRHNFAPLTVRMLVRLRISGLLDSGADQAGK